MPLHTHILRHPTPNTSAFHGRVIMEDFEMGIILDYLGEYSVVTRVFVSGRQEYQGREKEM